MSTGLIWTPVWERAIRQGATEKSCSETDTSVCEAVIVLGLFTKNWGAARFTVLAKAGDTAVMVCTVHTEIIHTSCFDEFNSQSLAGVACWIAPVHASAMLHKLRGTCTQLGIGKNCQC